MMAKMTKLWGRTGGALLLALSVICFTAGDVAAQLTSDAEFIRNLRRQNYSEVMPYLVNGGNPNAREHDGTPALVVAVEIGDASLVRTLLDYKANPDLYNRSTGETALMRAARQGDTQSASLLVYYKADVNAIDNRGETALIKAVRAKAADIVELLVKSGADVELADYTGSTPLDYARRINSPRIVRLLENPPSPG
jgi:ankyrin repeat protein